MAITATYVSGTSFSVSGNQTSKLRKGQAVTLYQGVDGVAEVNVVSSSYSSGTGLTTCTVKQSYVRSGLATITRGLTYAEETSSNLTLHDHTSDPQGGNVPAAGLTDGEIDALQALPDAMSALEAELTDHTNAGHPHSEHAVLTGGKVSTDQLGSGTANGSTFLRGDQQYAIPPAVPFASPDWTPPAISHKDADEIYIAPGRYYQGGYRHRGQYKDLTGLGSYWDISSRFAVDIDATYTAGTSSGLIGGAKVNSSWYSIFMIGSTANDIIVLPFVRVKAVAYTAPDTIINPGDHDTGASYEDAFLVTNDAWNGYRLLKWKAEDITTDGNVYTIADTVDGTHDEIRLTGDKTGEIVAGDWFQLVPPSATSCVYLGAMRIGSDGNLRWFNKKDWSYQTPVTTITGTLNTTPANTELASAVCPSAGLLKARLQVGSEGTSVYSVACILYTQTGTGMEQIYMNVGAGHDYMRLQTSVRWQLDATVQVKNTFTMYNGSDIAALLGQIIVTGFEE